MRVEPRSGGRPPVALLAAVLLALAGCGGAEAETSGVPRTDGAPGAAQPRQPRDEAQLAARLSTACERATEGRTLPRPGSAGELGEYARGSLTRTQGIVAELAGVQVAGAAQPQVASLRSALSSLVPLYEQAAAAAAQRDRAALGRLTPVIPAAEQSADELARGLGAPACAPGG